MYKQNNREIGTAFETKAAQYLKQNGVRILECNYRCRSGEIDLIGMDDSTLVFFEVKYRKNWKQSGAASAVDWRKQRQISKVAAYYLYSHRYTMQVPCRFDVIAFDGDACTWIKNAFEYCGRGM